MEPTTGLEIMDVLGEAAFRGLLYLPVWIAAACLAVCGFCDAFGRPRRWSLWKCISLGWVAGAAATSVIMLCVWGVTKLAGASSPWQDWIIGVFAAMASPFEICMAVGSIRSYRRWWTSRGRSGLPIP